MRIAYANSDANNNRVFYTQLHAWLVRGGTHAHSRGALGWRLFPSQRKVLCDGRALLRRGGERFHAPI